MRVIISTFVLCAALISGLQAQFVAVSKTLGATKVTIAGAGETESKLSLMSSTFRNKTLYENAIGQLTTTDLTVAGESWSDDSFNPVEGVPTHFVEIIDGSGEGAMADIVDTLNGDTLVLSEDLTGFAVQGDRFRIRKHVTIAEIFGANNEAGLQGGGSVGEADEVILFDNFSKGVVTIWYATVEGFEGWYDTGFNPAGDFTIAPESGIMVKRKGASDLSFVISGEVHLEGTLVPVAEGLNLLGVVAASGETLANSGLYTGRTEDGVVGGGSVGEADEVIVVKGDDVNTYWYATVQGFEGWYDTGFNPADDVELPAGSAIFLKRKSPAPAFNWLARID